LNLPHTIAPLKGIAKTTAHKIAQNFSEAQNAPQNELKNEDLYL